MDTKSGKPVTSFDSGLGFDFSPDGATFAYSKSNGDIELIKIDGLKKIGQLNGYKDFTTSLSYSPDGKMIASTSNDVVNVWRISDRKRIKRFSAKVDALGSVCFSRDSSMVIAGQLAVCIWRISDGKLLYRKIPSDKQYYGEVFRDVSSLAPAKNSDIIAIGTMSRER
jgi:WD40 repeat protein